MLRAIALFMLISTAAQLTSASPNTFIDVINADREDLMNLLFKIGNAKEIATPEKFNKIICATEQVDANTCADRKKSNFATDKVAIFEALIAELMKENNLHNETENADQDAEHPEIIKAKLLKVIKKLKDDKRPLSANIKNMMKPSDITKLECKKHTKINIISAILSNDKSQCIINKVTPKKEIVDEQCNEDTTELIKNKCQDKNTCNFSVDKDLGHICACISQKYLNLTYSCTPIKENVNGAIRRSKRLISEKSEKNEKEKEAEIREKSSEKKEFNEKLNTELSERKSEIKEKKSEEKSERNEREAEIRERNEREREAEIRERSERNEREREAEIRERSERNEREKATEIRERYSERNERREKEAEIRERYSERNERREKEAEIRERSSEKREFSEKLNTELSEKKSEIKEKKSEKKSERNERERNFERNERERSESKIRERYFPKRNREYRPREFFNYYDDLYYDYYDEYYNYY